MITALQICSSQILRGRLTTASYSKEGHLITRMKMKYIRLERRGLPIFVLFSDVLMHDEMVACVKHHLPDAVPCSAGFVDGHYMDTAVCVGESTSTGLVAGPDDTAEIRRQFGVMSLHR